MSIHHLLKTLGAYTVSHEDIALYEELEKSKPRSAPLLNYCAGGIVLLMTAAATAGSVSARVRALGDIELWSLVVIGLGAFALLEAVTAWIKWK